MTTPSEPKKRNKGKKHISKHVLKAREAKDDATKEVAKAPPKPKKQKTDRVVKDPSEAVDYLKQWKNDKDDWKFNKNTQSWIIRHMYDAEKLDKSAFSLVTEYLQGLQGGTAKSWALADATKRALRYKEYEKSHTDGASEKEDNSKKEGEKETGKLNDADTEDLIRWNKLSDHDKRKEYKRARKVLEVLKE